MLAAVASAGATNGAGTVFIVEQGVVARTCSSELSVLFDENLDSNASKTEAEQGYGEEERLQFHVAKVHQGEGDLRRVLMREL